QKGMCKYCKIHCYSPQKRKEIKKVMRFAGPRMLLYAPWQVIKHWLKK
ncbi:MAG: nitrous oxide-stimulated promoter family protein, partial [Bacteroides sp.]|nr:nitrous oxide-stimulated promoter family protein [Bacteroides sp.]